MIEELLAQLFDEGYTVTEVKRVGSNVFVTVDAKFTGRGVTFEKALINAMLYADMAGE